MKLQNEIRAADARRPPEARPPRAARLCLAALFALTPALAATTTPGQEMPSEETTRKLWDTAFAPKAKKRTVPARRAARRVYRVATPRVSPARVSGETVVGVTVWRLRPSRAGETGERLLEHEGPGAAAWTPERVPANAALSEGDRVRLSIEAARDGYLYVIDREQYADGTLGEPYLIFPTTRTLGGDNRVQAGRLVDIPGQEDATPYFTLRRGRGDQVGELLSVIVTKAPLEGLRIGDKAQKLSAEQVARWEKTWGGQVGRLELEGGGGEVWTKEERAASAGVGHRLNPDAPGPQTLYYNPEVKSHQPLLINVALRYAPARPPARRRRG